MKMHSEEIPKVFFFLMHETNRNSRIITMKDHCLSLSFIFHYLMSKICVCIERKNDEQIFRSIYGFFPWVCCCCCCFLCVTLYFYVTSLWPVKNTFRQRGGDKTDGIHPYVKRLTERHTKREKQKQQTTKLKIRFFLIQTNKE